MGNQTVELFDAFNRLSIVESRSSAGVALRKSRFFYDGCGHKKVQKESIFVDGAFDHEYLIEWIYNNMGNIQEIIEQPGTASEKRSRSEYNLSGLLSRMIKPDGIEIQHEYDRRSRLARIFSSDGTGDYSYDLNSNPVEVRDRIHSSAQTYSYDGWNRKVGETSDGASVNFSYDAIGRLTEYALPNRLSVTYLYEALLSKVVRQDSSNREVYSHSYNSYNLEKNLLESSLIGSLGTASFSWDALSRNISTTTPYWSEELKSFDAVGNLKESSITDAVGKANYTYSYDDLYQVIKETGPFNGSFIHDSLSNRREKGNSKYQLNDLNQLMSDGEMLFFYDKNGNPVEMQKGKSTLKLRYDAFDRLINVDRTGEFLYEYRYDAFYRRLQKKHSEWNRSSS
ncbi:MAG: hypothetical protein QRY74_05440 [Chlamydia sp.]